MKERTAAVWILGGWFILAATFSCWRIPFHDEYFSIALARDATPRQFIAALAADVHPLWVAWLDRAVFDFAGRPEALNVVHLCASFLALLLMRRVVARAWPDSSPVWTALAAFHPIVFLYAAGVRWYPFAFLADAVRAYAIWAAPRGSRREGALFATGCALGVAAGYGEITLVLLDCAWFLAQGVTAGRPRRSALVVAVGLSGAAASCLFAPQPTWRALIHGGTGFSPAPLLTWAALGPFGEALLPWPWTLAVLLAVPGAALGLIRVFRHEQRRNLGLWLLSVAGGWGCLTFFGVVHPRYSLALWYLITCAYGYAFETRGWARSAAYALSAYLLLDLALTWRGHDFAFSDENVLERADCDLLFERPHAALLLTNYPRTRLEVKRVCAPRAPIVSAGLLAQNVDTPGEEIAPLRDALRNATSVDFVSVDTSTSGHGALGFVSEEAQALLEQRCHLLAEHSAGTVPLYDLRRLVQTETPRWHYHSQRWECR